MNITIRDIAVAIVAGTLSVAAFKKTPAQPVKMGDYMVCVNARLAKPPAFPPAEDVDLGDLVSVNKAVASP